MSQENKTTDLILSAITELKNSNSQQERDLREMNQKIENYHITTLKLIHATEEKCDSKYVSIKEINAIRGLIVIVGILTTLVTTLVAFASGK